MTAPKVNKDDNEKIFCPHCGEEIVEIIQKAVKVGTLNITAKDIYACAKCRKIIPVSHSTYW